MNIKIIITLITLFLINICSSQNDKLKQDSKLQKILIEFKIPYKDELNKFKKLKNSDEYFRSANSRMKRLKSELDSKTIYIAIKEYQCAIKLNVKDWASYRNLSRLFLIIKHKELAMISIEKAIQYCGKADLESLYLMRKNIK